MVIGAVASSLYIVDAYRDLSIEGFTCMIIFKNFFSYALTYKVWTLPSPWGSPVRINDILTPRRQAYDWWLELKTVSTPLFNIIGTVQLVICLTSIPMCKSSIPGFQIIINAKDRPLADHLFFSLWPDIYGKRVRSYYYRHDILAACGLR